ncbi:class I SAM-dependent methyltransferase [Aurantiacibacter rhizosphaerae]|uniref:Methyltransferase n=1 Tax=Aurantiacibacter rhizosphaerae TaxID=2691582 RepID=A0A844XGG5_9SPHN|nr:class I SAM-dependent methyltransferase [Aurantiacibacter rhizosphaerae]MWV28910.1 hypothetical protein [Aurantiacibacter rhizosphaerae]
MAPLFAVAAFAVSAPALAEHHMAPSLEDVLAMDMRADDAPRDAYRHPVETLEFFQVEPGMTVVEYGPGGGWYTRVLAPWIAAHGTYYAVDGDSDQRSFSSRAAEGRTKSWPETFPGVAAGWTGVDADKIVAFESDEAPEGVAGTVDRILVFRALHGLLNGNRADSELRNMRSLLADDGMVGVVQHRAKADAPWSYANGSNGYLKQDDVVALFALNGFELVDSSEVNANPDDPANWDGGVWTLPPVLRYGEDDRARYDAIGESDRMTLLFKKAD